MKSSRFAVPVSILMIVALCTGTHTLALAEQKRPRPQTAEEKKTKACEVRNVECMNDCRNGFHLPIGSPSDKVRSCDHNCGIAFNVCMAAKRGGFNSETFSGQRKGPVLRRGIEGEGSTTSPTVPEEPGK